jgi:membrane protein implicated in regulation of membrane protease activity
VSRVERLFLHASVFLTSASGILLLWMKHFMSSADPFSIIHHPWQPQTLAAHVLAAPLLVFALGLILRGHILDRWREGPHNGTGRSGVLVTLLAPALILSGYFLEVAVAPASRRVLAGTHWALGLLFALLYVLHLAVSWPAARAKKRRRRGSRQRGRVTAGGRLDPSGTQGLQSRDGTAWAQAVARSDGRQP